jgi:hypothetical protein
LSLTNKLLPIGLDLARALTSVGLGIHRRIARRCLDEQASSEPR